MKLRILAISLSLTLISTFVGYTNILNAGDNNNKSTKKANVANSQQLNNYSMDLYIKQKNDVNQSNKKSNLEKYSQIDSLTNNTNKKITIEDYLNIKEKNFNFNGSVIIAKDGVPIINKGYGFSDYQNKIQNTPTTQFLIASMTKQFVSLSIMQLCEKGKLSVDDKLSKYIPDFPYADKITIKHLLTHSSGIQNFFKGNARDIELQNEAIQLKDKNEINIINILKNGNPEFVPGERYEYCNSGYIILGYIIEQVTNMELYDYMKINIFDPINMKNTMPLVVNGIKKLDTKGYLGYLGNYTDKRLQDETNLTAEVLLGGGYLVSTTEDLLKWSNAIDKDLLVNNATMKEIFKPRILVPNYGEGDDIQYGYGWFVEEVNGVKKYSHGGTLNTFNSQICKYSNGYTIITLTNKSPNYQNLPEFESDIYRILLGENIKLAPYPSKGIKIDKNVLNKYLGEYIVDNSNPENGSYKADIKEQNNCLFMYFTSRSSVEPEYLIDVYAKSQNMFFNGSFTPNDKPLFYKFETDLNGKVSFFDPYSQCKYLKTNKIFGLY